MSALARVLLQEAREVSNVDLLRYCPADRLEVANMSDRIQLLHRRGLYSRQPQKRQAVA